jgi:AcrR family transcriptional regulator
MASPAPTSRGAVAPRALRRDAERNRERILASAREVFAEHGLAATLDDVAAHAGVGVGTVYRRFADKDELIDELFEDRIGEIVALAEAAIEQEDGWGAMVAFMEQSMALQAADRGLKDVVLSTDRGRERVTLIRERLHPLIDQMVKRAQDQGTLRADVSHTDVQLVAMTVSTMMDATRDVDPDVYRRVMRILLDGLRADRAAPSPLPGRSLTGAEADEVMRCMKQQR